MLKRVLAGVLGIALILGVFSAPAMAKERNKAIHGEFVARAVPAPDYVLYTCGQRGVNHVAFPFKAPSRGVFRADLRGFVGDWDIWLEAIDGEYITGSFWGQTLFRDPAHEYFEALLKKGEEVNLVACNMSGEPEVTVDYSFEFGKLSDVLGPTIFEERVPINFVFLGYDERQVTASKFKKVLPDEYRPVVRSRAWYGIRKFLGIHYTYDYDISFTDRSYEDRFFRYLTKIGKEGKVTFYQQRYNTQQRNSLEIKSNFEIQATDVEKWLAFNPPKGVDTTENTLFFINWYDRPDFKFHVYTKLGEADPDTGVDHGKEDFQKLMAWGGTTPDDPESGLGALRRVWFYDLSAGPSARAGNWAVDTPATTRYFLPPVWEYSANGYRLPTLLSKDLGKVARYIGINLLFTTSPIYPPDIGAPDIADTVNLDLNGYEGMVQNGSDAGLQPRRVLKSVADLMPLHDFSVDYQDLPFTDPTTAACYSSITAIDDAYFFSYYNLGNRGAWPAYYTYFLYAAPSCYPERPYYSYANFFLHNAMNLEGRLDDPKVYEAPSFTYFVEGCDRYVYANAQANAYVRCNAPLWSGWADDNWRDGTQSFTYNILSSQDLAAGWGITGTNIHEYGHHFGMSHPHDGYDFEKNLHYGPGGDTAFVYVGSESNSVMNYLATNDEFGQFDRDNMNRFMAAVYAEHALKITQAVLRDDRHAEASENVAASFRKIGEAKAAFAGHDYLAAWALSKVAYEFALAAARQIGIDIERELAGRYVDPPGLTPSDDAPKVLSPEILSSVVEPPWFRGVDESHEHHHHEH